jgi:signal transduction histidine kinase
MRYMKFNPFITLPLGAILVGFVYASYSLLLGMPVDSVPVERTLNQLQIAQQRIAQDVGFSKSIGVVRVRLDETYRGYCDAVSSLRNLLPPRADVAKNTGLESVRSYLAETDCFLDDVDVFVRRAAVFQNSLDYSSTLIQKLRNRLLDETSDASIAANRVLANAVDALRTDRARVAQPFEQLRQSIIQLLPQAPKNIHSDLALLQQHLLKLQELSPELDHLERRILDSPTTPTLNAALDRIAETTQEGFRQSVRSQRVLLCVSGALGAYLILSYWQLRKFARQLHLSNESLEARVLERTAELAARNRDLVQAQKLEAVGKLAAGVAHELNTPMQYVHDNIEFVDKSSAVLLEILETVIAKSDGGQPPQVWRQRSSEIAQMLETRGFDRLRTELPLSIQDALHGADRIVQIVRAMTHFTLPSSDDFCIVDLNAALRDAGIVAGTRCKNVELEFDLESDLPHVKCLPSEVNQVLLNLLVNSSDAVATRKDSEPEHLGRIILRSRSKDGWIRLEVQDNGTGIPDDIRDRIFEPFFTTKEVGHGTGQGLAVAWRIITELHGGKLLVDTKPGLGTTFAIVLPIDGPAESHVLPLEPAELQTQTICA